MKKKKNRKVQIGLIVAGVSSVILGIIVLSCVLALSYFRQAPYEPVPEEVIRESIQKNGESDPTRNLVVQSAVSLVGKVHYFWGGKSFALNWDDQWGEPAIVVAEGSDSSGSERPYGLDCSGFIAWSFAQTGMSRKEVSDLVGLGTYYQFNNCQMISWKELRPGDLAFQSLPGQGENHVGICIGFNNKGKPLFVHCNATYDNVVVTGAGDVFKYAARPQIYD